MPSNRISDEGLIAGYAFAILGIAVALFMPFSVRALETDKLIEYDGVIALVEREERFRPRRSRNRVHVTINYDGGHVETHSIRSSHKLERLDQIRDLLAENVGESVIVSFLPNDRTLAEIKTGAGEVLLDQSQLRTSTLFTSVAIGSFSIVLFILMAVLHQQRQKPRMGGANP